MKFLQPLWAALLTGSLTALPLPADAETPLTQPRDPPTTGAPSKSPTSQPSRAPEGKPAAVEPRQPGRSEALPRYAGPRDIRRILASRVPPLRFDDTPLQDVLDWVQDYSGALVTVRWGVLERCGIERETPVSLRVNGNQFAHVLAAVLDQAGSAAGVKLAYEASAEQFVFSTHADLSREMIVRVYDVRDLLIDIPMAPHKPPENFRQFAPGEVFHTHVHRTFVTPPPSLSPATPVSPGFPIGVVVRPEPLFPAPSGSTREIVSEDERLQEFMELILNSVEPDTWLANNADAPGTIFPYKGVLIVRNSRYVHQQIQDALSASRQHGPSAP